MLILGIIVFIILSAIFSGTEIAFISANRVGIEIDKHKNSITGKILSSFYDNPKEFIGVMLIGNNISIVVLTFLFSQLLHPWLSLYTSNDFVLLLVETLIITVIILIFAEFLPKSIFKSYANEILRALAIPMYVVKVLLRIPTLIFTSLSGFLLKYFFKTTIEDDNIPLTRLDLEHYIEENIDEEDDIEKEMFQKALNLDQLKARDIMIPRTEIVAIDVNATKEELIETFENSKHSRIIVYNDEIENVLGYIHHQQLIREHFHNIKDYIIEVPFIPETVNAKDLLLQFIKESQNIALIVDEYGSIAGLITLEDLIEEIFGKIEDEYDKEDTIEKKLNKNEFVFSARLEIDDLNEEYNLSIPEGEYNTLSGFIVSNLGRIPESGEEFTIDNFKIRILKVLKNRIELVKITKLNNGDQND
ncbi:MAG TPA: HlyC/CorC family transporter [Bacteroidetes bacterium]|nr:HlyC/CorC family transporter [Bacteroidota bacterium]